MRLKITRGAAAVALVGWVVGTVCGAAFAGALPIWNHQSLATVNNPKSTHDQLNAMLQAGWEIERVVPERYAGGSELPTYVLRRPSFFPGAAATSATAADPTPTPTLDPLAAAMVSRAHTLANELRTLASLTNNPFALKSAQDAFREALAEAENNRSPQAGTVQQMSPDIRAAIASRNADDLSRLAVKLDRIQ